MVFFRKLFKLPSPVDLGWSDTDALPMRDFSAPGTEHTWEDWHETVKKMHPVKYFLAETLANFLKFKIWFQVWIPLKNAHYWFASHFIPSRRYHILDLRQPKGNRDSYRYGWCDIDHRMLYAIFNLLNIFVEKELPHFYCPSEEDVKTDPTLKDQRELVLEVQRIHQWWNVDRKRDMDICTDLHEQWYKLRKSESASDRDKARHMYQVMNNADRDVENKTDEMITRLMKIRRSLWT